MAYHRFLAQLAEAADPKWVRLSPRLEGEGLSCELSLPLPDGDVVRYHLELSVDAQGQVFVAERPDARRLPAFCPGRHINFNGTFCLGWGPSKPPEPVDLESAQKWWALLVGFLRLQEEAALLRRWRKGCEWAHGSLPDVERQLDEARAALVEPFASTAEAGAYSLAPSGKRLRLRRRPCPCGGGRRFRDCHEPGIARVLWLKSEAKRVEERFWAGLAGQRCCGTIDGCRLHEGNGDA